MESPQPTPDEHAEQAPLPWRAALVAAGLAFAVRILHASFLSETTFFDGPIIDAMTYFERAKGIVAGRGWGAPFYQPPLYLGWLAGLLKLGIGTPWGIAISQSLLGSITVGLLVFVAHAALAQRDLVGHSRTVWITGLVAACYGPLVLFDLEWLPPPVVNLPLVVAWLLCLTAGPRVGWREPVAGLCLGTAATGWGLSLIMIPALAALRVGNTRATRMAPIAVLLLVLGAAAPVALVWKANAKAGAPNVMVSWNAGINQWLGNGPNWHETWRARPGADFEPELERPDRAGVTKAGERSAFFSNLVWQDVQARPFAAIARTIEKFYYAWHGREIRRNQDMEILRDASPVLRALQWEKGLFFPFGLVAPLGMLGVWRRRRELVVRVLAITAVAYTAAIACFFVASRYRLIVPVLLIPLAADQVAHLWRERRVPMREAIAFFALLTVLNLPNRFTFSLRADTMERGILTAQAQRQAGRVEEAERIARDLATRYPDRANAQMLYAEMLLARRDWRAAIEPLQRTAEFAPRATGPWLALGNALKELRFWPASEAAYLYALALHPHHAQAIRGLAVLYMEGNRPTDAIRYLRRFLAEGYTDPGVEFDLGRLLIETGKPAEGIPFLEALVRAHPDDTEARHLIDRARASL